MEFKSRISYIKTHFVKLVVTVAVNYLTRLQMNGR